jgi:hypothetical protein
MAIPSKTRVNRGVPVTVSFSDSINLINDQVKWSPKGVSLMTKWPFREGTELEFAFVHRGERHCCTGVVVGCHPLRRPMGFFETVLFFVETPCSELQKAANDCHLAKQNRSAGTTQITTHNHAANGVSHEGTGKVAARNRSAH